MNVCRPALPLLALLAFAVSGQLAAQPVVLQAIDFSSYTPGAGVLITNPAVDETGFSGFIYPSFPAGGGAGDPLTGIVADSPLGNGAAAYFGGAGTHLELGEADTYFEQTVFSGSLGEAPANLIGSAKSLRTAALDFLIERNGGTNEQGWEFYVYDAVDQADDQTFAYHSYVRINADNTVSIADNSTDLAAAKYHYTPTDVTLSAGVAYHLELVVDYDHARWSATISAVDGSAKYVIAQNRAINSANYTLSGWTTAGTLDIGMFGLASAGNAGLLDRMYVDDYTITAESDARFWHQQTADDYSAYTPGRTVLDGKGHIYMPWTIFANGADMNNGHFVGQLIRLNESDGRRDPTFNLDTRVKRVGYATPASDGEHMLLAVDIGNSSTIVRVDDTGAIDPTFTAPLFAYSIRFLTVQPDGKIVVAATDLTNPSVSPSALDPGAPAVYRLEVAGALDTSFAPAVMDHYGVIFGPPAVDGAGRIYLVGAFDHVNGIQRSSIARLSSTGQVDLDFANPDTMPSGFIAWQARSAALQSTGDVVVIGQFQYDARGTDEDQVMAIRFKSDGTFDTGFAQPLRSQLGFAGGNARARAMAMQPDDKFIVVSDRLVRLEAGGTVDASFASVPFGGEAYWLARDKDGTIYVPGLVTITTPAGDVDLSAGGVGRFLADGSLDPSFSVGGWGISAYPTSANLLSEGSAVVGGYFNRFGSVAAPGLGFLAADGSFDPVRLAATLEAAGRAGQTFGPTQASVAPAGGDRTYVLLSGLDSTQLFRLDASGLPDQTFDAAIPANFNLANATLNASGSGSLYLSVGVPDEAALVAGGATSGTFIRVGDNGVIDPTFQPAFSSLGQVVRGQGNAITKIIVGQLQVLQVDDQDRPYVVQSRTDGSLQIARLTSSGAIDPTFAPTGLGKADSSSGYTAPIFDPVTQATSQFPLTYYFSTSVQAVQPMWNGSIYVAGGLSLPNLPRGLLRLQASGAVDPTFAGEGLAPRTSDDFSASFISALAVDHYRRLYFAGLFDRFNGTPLPGIGRLNADGTLDTAWQPGVSIVDYPQAAVSLKIHDDQLYVFGTAKRDGDPYPTGNPQIITLDVPETAPTITALADVVIGQNVQGAPQSFTVDDNETPAGQLMVNASSSNQNLIPDGSIVIGFGGGEGGGGGGVIGGIAGAPAIGGRGNAGLRTIRLNPTQGQSGKTTITLTVSDGEMEADTSFNVTVDGAPTISHIADQTTKEDTATAVIPFTLGDAETAASKLTLTKATSNATLVPVANITLGGSGANRTVKITPAANQSGTATITLTVADGLKQTATTSFKVTVTAVNDLPVITKPADVVLAKGTNRTITFKVGDTETSATALTVSRASSNPALVPTANLILGGSGANRTLKLTPVATQTGSATITLTVADTSGGKTATTFKVTVENPPAIAAIADQTTNEDTSTAAIAVKLSDTDTSTAKLTLTATSSNATLVPANAYTFGGSGANRTLKIKPGANQSGTATITLTVSDGLLTANRAFKLTVKPVNDAPTISAIANQTTNKNTSTAAIAFTIGDAETAATKLTLTRTSSNPTLIPTANITLGGSGANRTVTIKPASNKTGSAKITLTVSDGALTASTSFTVTVNAPPTITTIANQTVVKNGATAALAFTISDAETTATKLTLTKASSNPTFVPVANIVLGGTGANRTVKITPAKNLTGSAKITLTVSDGNATASTSFTVTVK